MPERLKLDIDAGDIQQQMQRLSQSTPTVDPGMLGRGPIARAYESMLDLRKAQSLQRTAAQPEIGSLRLAQAQIAQSQAQQRLERQIGRLQETPFQRFLGGVNVGAGMGGQNQLSGVAANLGEMGKLLSHTNPALGGAAVAIGALALAAGHAAQTLTQIGQTRITSGGTSTQVALGRALGGAVGVGDIGATAAAFRDRIATDPMAMMEASKFGVRALPRGFGTPPNQMDMLLRGIQALRQAPNDKAAQGLLERLPELAPFAILRDASDETMGRIEQLAQSLGRLANPEQTAKAVEFNLQMEMMKQRFEILAVTVGGPVLGAINQVFEGFGQLSDEISALFGGGRRGQQKPQNAQEAYLKALQENTGELRYLNQGMFGGGERARAAIPPGLKGQALDYALRAGAAHLGQF